MLRTISIVLPVYMEADNIREALASAHTAVRNAGIDEYEVIIIDCLRADGTHDGTPDIADELAAHDPRVTVIHNRAYVNLGFKYFQGVRAAKYEYITWIPGDNENTTESITAALRRIGEADIVIPYTANQEVRPFARRFISVAYTTINNLLFGLNLQYYNGLSVYEKRMLLVLPETGNSFAFAAEILIPLLKSGASYVEVPIMIQPRRAGKSSAFHFHNIMSVVTALGALFWRVQVLGERIKIK